MSIISLIENIEIRLGVDKILTYFQDKSKEKEKRRYLEFIRHNKDLADDLERAKLPEAAEMIRQHAKNAQDTLDELKK